MRHKNTNQTNKDKGIITLLKQENPGQENRGGSENKYTFSLSFCRYRPHGIVFVSIKRGGGIVVHQGV